MSDPFPNIRAALWADDVTAETIEAARREHGEAMRLAGRLEATERELRMELWLHHGCVPMVDLYGDDGEMQCSKHGLDFKRHDLADLIERTKLIRVENTHD